MTRRERIQMLARHAGVANGYKHMTDTGAWSSTPCPSRADLRAILFGAGVHPLWVSLAALVHGRTIRFAYDLGYATGQKRARERKREPQPVPSPSRDQKGRRKW